jgi:hypothetical protein
MDELISLLNDERQLLDELLYRLVAARGVLAAGEMRYLARASAEIEQVVNDVYAAESRRAEGIGALATRLGCAPDHITLRALAGAAPEPYRTMLEQLHVEFLRLTDEIERTISVNKTLATRGAAELGRLLSALGGTNLAADKPLTYSPTGPARRTGEPRAIPGRPSGPTSYRGGRPA